MARPQSAISEEDIAWAIGASPTGRETDRAIAERLWRGISIVRATLRDFVRDGVVRRIVDGENVVFAMIPVDERVTVLLSEDDEAEDGSAIQNAERAERIFRERIGNGRRRDDPGSLAETQRLPEIFRGRITGDYDRTLGGVSSVYG